MGFVTIGMMETAGFAVIVVRVVLGSVVPLKLSWSRIEECGREIGAMRL